MKVLAIGLISLLALAGCSMPENTGGTHGQRVLKEFDIPGTEASASLFCIDDDKFLWMSASHKGSLQLVREDDPKCK